jgi:hypothetical protein
MKQNDPYEAFDAALGSIDEFDLRPLAAMAAQLGIDPVSRITRLMVTVEIVDEDNHSLPTGGRP